MAPKKKSRKPSGAIKNRPKKGENNSTSNSRVCKKSSKRKKQSKQVILEKEQTKHDESFTNEVISALKLEKSAALARELSKLENITSKMTAFAIDGNTSPADGIPAPLRRLEPSLPAGNNALNNIVDSSSSSVTAIHFPPNVSQPVPRQRPVILNFPELNIYFFSGGDLGTSPNNISFKLKNSKSETIAKKKDPLQCIWQFVLLQQQWKKVFNKEFDVFLPDRLKSSKGNQTFVSASLKTFDSTQLHYVLVFFLSGISPTYQLFINSKTKTICWGNDNDLNENQVVLPVFERQSYTRVSPEKSVFFGRVSLEKKDPEDGVYLHTLIVDIQNTITESWRRVAISRGPQNDAEELMDFLPNPTADFTWPLDHIAWSFGDNFFITGGNTVLSKDKVRRDYPKAGEVSPLNVAIKVDLVTGHLVTFTEPLAASSPQDGVPCPRFGSATVESKDRNLVYVVGGQDSEGDLLNDIWVLNKTSNMWRLLPMRLPLGLVHAGVALDTRDNQLLIFGGKMSDVKVEANGGGNRRVRNQNINANQITALLPFMLQVKLPTSNPLLLQRFAFQTIQKEAIKTAWAHFYQQIRSVNGNSVSRPGRLHCILNRIQKNKDVTKVGTLFKRMLSVENNFNGSQMQANTLLKSYYNAIIQKEFEQNVDQQVGQEIDQEMNHQIDQA